MLSLFTQRVSLSAHRSAATYTRILPSSASTLRARTITGTRLHASTVQTNLQRDATTEAAATTETGPSTESNTMGRTKPRARLTPEEKEARAQLLRARMELDMEKNVALRAKQKARAEKEKEAAAQKRKHLAEKKKKLADAEKVRKQKEKEREKVRKEREEKKARKEKEKEKKAKEAKKLILIKPPPRRMTGFPLYLKETKKTVPVGMVDWKNLTEEERQKYTASARVIQDKRKEEFDAFVKTITPQDLKQYNRQQTAKGKQRIHVKFSGLSRQGGPFMKYIDEFRMRPDQAGKGVKEMAKAAGVAWNSLTQEEKDRYKSKPTESIAAKETSQSL